MALSTTKVDVNRGTTGIALPEEVMSDFFSNLVEGSVVMSAARRMAIPGTGATINIVTGDPVPQWVAAETNEKAVSTPTFSNKTMTPYKLAVIVPFSNEFRRDLPTLYDEVIRRIPYALGRAFDTTVFFGTAPGENFDTLSSVDAVDLQAAPADAINGAITDIAIAGGTADGIVLAPQGYGILTGAKNTDGSLTFGGSYNSTGQITPFGLPVYRTSSAYKAGSSAANTVGFVGDWESAVYGVVQDVALEYSDQATINDGEAQINLWQRNMFAVRAEMEVGFVIKSTDYFVRLTDTYPAA